MGKRMRPDLTRRELNKRSRNDLTWEPLTIFDLGGTREIKAGEIRLLKATQKLTKTV